MMSPQCIEMTIDQPMLRAEVATPEPDAKRAKMGGPKEAQLVGTVRINSGGLLMVNGGQK